MKTPILELYLTKKRRTQILIDDNWSIEGMLNFLFNFLFPKNFKTQKIITSSFLPLNRFYSIQKINYYLMKQLLKRILGKQKLYLLWINHPDLFKLHNFASFEYLVLSVNKSFLKSKNKYIRYKSFFEKGWIFAYSFRKEPQSRVFKNKTKKQILSQIENF